MGARFDGSYISKPKKGWCLNLEFNFTNKVLNKDIELILCNPNKKQIGYITEKYSLNSTDKRGNEHGEITTADT